MRYVMYSDDAGTPRPAVHDGTSLHPFADDVPSLDAFVKMAPADREKALGRLGAAFPAAGAKLLSPMRPSKNVFCVGRNYLAHAEEGARANNVELKLPDVPTFFTKAPTAIADPEQTLELSYAVTKQWDWEAELAVVIGVKCRDVAPENALDVIFGYTCLNDVTGRDLQRAHVQWFKGKSLDDSCPIGPVLVDAKDIGDPQNLDIALRVNGKTMQSSNTSKMIFDVRAIIASLSKGMTLEPGDVIATGTPEGVGFAMDPPTFLKDGDVMEVDVEKIGILRNPVHIGA
jgi:2-keto-4-pentenoate hydratase/2-oxohepta-3-ene-1,7-dioic acid hydratase in catechol pathway